ncbi:hypothetical protein K227x_09510 [Rubripirellula lacrimiformis]|uniref:Glycosyltransferase 61 catalytic domain-containing protein n=1 Tax=Rubripirellula lacrimiformis TaxID=1930273 RepID=A0A517N619_9BACT|nr:glycosyltransferase family 61 protein [Rubripirellula lacrimiformis]QDT02573.1 hypothetical protein K227x_09510 [Rubripirellula lacrimiformis]
MIVQTYQGQCVTFPPAVICHPTQNAGLPNYDSNQNPEYRLQLFNEVDVHGRGPILDQNGRALAEAFVNEQHKQQWENKGGPLRLSIERVFQRTERLDERSIWFVDNWSAGYFHWMCDALPRLELALRLYQADELTVVLPHKFGRYPYFLESLSVFGLRDIRLLRRFQRLRCRELVVPGHVARTGHHDPQIMDAMRQRFRSAFGDSSVTTGKRIYISRRDAGRRKVVNESEFMHVLERHGFEVMVAGQMSWADQVRTAMNAEYMISNHGAGLSNMMMMQPSSSVMEIHTDGKPINGCYHNLAGAADIHYYYMFAKPENAAQSMHSGNVIVDPSLLDSAISRMVSA